MSTLMRYWSRWFTRVILFTESYPECSVSVTEVDYIEASRCDREPELINISCAVSYSGDTPPTLSWQSSSWNHQASVHINKESRRITSSVQIPSNSARNGDAFMCEAVLPSSERAETTNAKHLVPSKQQRHTCTTKSIRVFGKRLKFKMYYL